MGREKPSISLDTAISVAGVVVGVLGTIVTLYTYRGNSLTRAQLAALEKLGQLEQDAAQTSPKTARASFDRRDFQARTKVKGS